MTRGEILATAKPILFNTDMVSAILEGRKTVTRKVAKNIIPFDDKGECFNIFRKGEWIGPVPKFSVVRLHAPYKVGDYLYIRETFCNANKSGCEPDYYYYADTKICEDYDSSEWKWIPSIHMPKEAARIFLRVTDVRVEWLHAMTLDDFLEEGVVLRPEAFNDPENAYWQA